MCHVGSVGYLNGCRIRVGLKMPYTSRKRGGNDVNSKVTKKTERAVPPEKNKKKMRSESSYITRGHKRKWEWSKYRRERESSNVYKKREGSK